ncbi:T9SS C-terminal target domain-containing protein [Sphingobacteriales bacterium UPWRP_1]|nr:hypothetical protein B6N25_00470 [Sphingobacteriales bacterium TSM_CSS]PSJ71920.1 T9SS C-terminal target domain-containing protein [Sphingobacteriales bacterium UPWRP_1]
MKILIVLFILLSLSSVKFQAVAQCSDSLPIANAGVLSFYINGIHCTNNELPAVITNPQEADGFAQVYVVTHPDTALAYYYTTLNIRANKGHYLLWGINLYTPVYPVPETMFANTWENWLNIEASNDCIDISEPLSFMVADSITMIATPVCDVNLGNYILNVTISGGAPGLLGLGAYGIVPSPTNPFDFFTVSGAPVYGTINNNGNGYLPGSVVTISMTSDGSLCFTHITVAIPEAPCFVSALETATTVTANVQVQYDVVTLNNISNITHARIYNANGQLCLQKVITQPSAQINISHLPNGMYILHLANTNGIQCYKFILAL